MRLDRWFIAVVFVLGLIVVLFGCSQPHIEVEGIQGIRDEFIDINDDFGVLLGAKAQLVNVGSKVNAGDGDPINLALFKIDTNLKQLTLIGAPVGGCWPVGNGGCSVSGSFDIPIPVQISAVSLIIMRDGSVCVWKDARTGLHCYRSK